MLVHDGNCFSVVDDLDDGSAVKPGFVAVPVEVMAKLARKDSSGEPEPDRAAAIGAYNAKLGQLEASGDPRPERTIAVKHPQLHAGYIAAVNAG